MLLYAGLDRDDPEKANLTPIVVFLAFSIESYLNSLGARELEIWDEIERLPWRSKVEILHKVAGRTPDWGREPLQFATEVFRLRDKLAHGKPEQVLGPWVDEDVLQGVLESGQLQPDWYQGINKKWALDAKVRFHALMEYLGEFFGLHESDHLMMSSGGVHVDNEAEA